MPSGTCARIGSRHIPDSMTGQAIRFLIAGGLAALVNWSSRFAYSRIATYEIAVVLAYVTGMAIAFRLMRSWVFHGENRPVGRQVVTFVAVNVLGLLQTLIVSSLFARWILPPLGMGSHVEAIAHAAGVGAPVITSFIGHKWVTFGKSAQDDIAARVLLDKSGSATRTVSPPA